MVEHRSYPARGTDEPCDLISCSSCSISRFPAFYNVAWSFVYTAGTSDSSNDMMDDTLNVVVKPPTNALERSVIQLLI